MRSYITLGALVSSVAALTAPPDGALTVGSDGTYATVSTPFYGVLQFLIEKQIQQAIDALDTGASSTQTIFIYSGTYNEQVKIPAFSGGLDVYGYTEDDASYSGNGVTVQQSCSQTSCDTNNDGTGMLHPLSIDTDHANFP